MYPVKITVLRCFTKEDIFGDAIPEEITDIPSPCQVHSPGQEYTVNGEAKPEGFCTWAFNDIFRDLVHLQRGGDFPWVGKPGTMFTSCTDGRKTVVFKLERVE